MNKTYSKYLYYAFLLFTGFLLFRSLLDVPSIAYIFYTYVTNIPLFPMFFTSLAQNTSSAALGILSVAMYAAALFAVVWQLGGWRSINRKALAVITAILAVDAAGMLLATLFDFASFTDDQLRLFRMHRSIEMTAAVIGAILLIQTRKMMARKSTVKNNALRTAAKALCAAYLVYQFVLPIADFVLKTDVIGKSYIFFPAALVNVASVWNLGAAYLRLAQDAVIVVLVVLLAEVSVSEDKTAFRCAIVLTVIFAVDAAALIASWICAPSLPAASYAAAIAIEALLAVFFGKYAHVIKGGSK